MSERDRDRGAELRAKRVRWKGRSRNMSRASKSMGERLRKMNDQASTLDKRLHPGQTSKSSRRGRHEVPHDLGRYFEAWLASLLPPYPLR